MYWLVEEPIIVSTVTDISIRHFAPHVIMTSLGSLGDMIDLGVDFVALDIQSSLPYLV